MTANENYTKILLVMEMLNLDKIKVYGRSAACDGIATDWTASGIEFCADCEGDVEVTFHAPGVQKLYFSVYINGEKTMRLCINEEIEPSRRYVCKVASGLHRGIYDIEIIRQSEAERGCAEITDINLNGGFLMRKPYKKLIEFIGDSITCGYANLASCTMPPEVCSESPWEDGTEGYAYLTARALGYDFSLLSRQGTGIVAGWDYLTNPMGAIPRVYGLTSFYRDETPYDFARPADIVVINLGTNDIYKYLGEEKDENLTDADFIDTIYNVLCDFSDKNGDPLMIVAVGMMTNPQNQAPLYRWYDEAISRFTANRGKIIHFCHLPENYEGGKAHPNVAGHHAAAKVLTEFIKKLI